MTTENEKMEVKPCPFCNGNAVMERRGTARYSMIIACEDCGCRLESGDVVGLTRPENYKWNIREESRPPSPHLELLRECLQYIQWTDTLCSCVREHHQGEVHCIEKCDGCDIKAKLTAALSTEEGTK